MEKLNGLTVDGSGNVFAVDAYNNAIRKVSPGGVVTTIAGSTTSGTADGSGTNAQFNYPTAVAVEGSGNLYVTEFNSSRVRKID